MSDDAVEIDSKLLGSLVVPREQIFGFSEGILGFPDARTFALIPAEREGFFWLQSLEWAALTFLLVDPFRFVENYSVDMGRYELGDLYPDDEGHLLVLSILTLPRRPDGVPTANLQGPLAFNLVQKKARQVVLEKSSFGLRFPIDMKRD
ncbi:MAG: flagellar assembly protein FliW [Gemmatimonadota bacterium]